MTFTQTTIEMLQVKQDDYECIPFLPSKQLKQHLVGIIPQVCWHQDGLSTVLR